MVNILTDAGVKQQKLRILKRVQNRLKGNVPLNSSIWTILILYALILFPDSTLNICMLTDIVKGKSGYTDLGRKYFRDQVRLNPHTPTSTINLTEIQP